MGSVTVKKLGGFRSHPNTRDQFDRQITQDQLEERLKRIESFRSLPTGKVWYVFGLGGHRKATYRELAARDGIEVVYCESVIPWYFAPLRLPVASYSGLIRIDDLGKLASTFLKVVSRSMAGIYCFDQRLEEKFLREARGSPAPEFLDLGVKEDPGYFFYVVDADNAESATGLYEIVSCGRESPPSIPD